MSKPVKWIRPKQGQNPHTFADIKSVGYVNEKLQLGVLKKIVRFKSKVVFEFELKGPRKKIRYDAWSTLNSDVGKENYDKLQINYSYVIKGQLQARTRSKKYDRSSSSTAKFNLFIGKITVLSKNYAAPANNDIKSLAMVRKEVDSKVYGHTPLKNLKILTGEIYRYWGCEKCFTAIKDPPQANGMYYCKTCKIKGGKRIGRVCSIVRNLVVSDSKKEILSGLVVYHNEIEMLIGKDELERICNSITDTKARECFDDLSGEKIDGTIVHQRPSGSSNQRFNQSRVYIKDIRISQSSPDSNVICRYCEDDDSETDSTDDTGSETDSQSTSILNTSDGESEIDENECIRKPITGSYDLSGSLTGHVGLAMIINIDSYKYPRGGSRKDVRLLEEVLPSVNIAIFGGSTVSNPTSREEIENMLYQFKSELIAKDYPSCLFIFMGHGKQNFLKLNSREFVNVYQDIMCQFSEENFQEFRGKPKIFIFATCQRILEGLKKFRISAASPMADFLWVTPCLPGQPSLREKRWGTFFVQAFAKALRRHKNLELYRILQKVQDRLRYKHRGKQGFCVPTIHSRCFSQFYFSK